MASGGDVSARGTYRRTMDGVGASVDGGVGAYTGLALVFEFATAGWSGRLLLREAV